MRAALLALLLASGVALSAQQNISAPGLVPTVAPGVVTTWTCGLNGIAASLTQCQAAPAAGLKLYITDLTVQTGTGSNCATGTAALFPVSGTANRWNAPITTQSASNFKFTTPLAAPAASAVCLIGVATNTISVQMQGYTAP